MLIGIDCSRAFASERTGTENYTFYLLQALLSLPTEHTYRLYVRKLSLESDEVWIANIRNSLPATDNFEIAHVKTTRLWTQWGLAWELWRHTVDALFVPAHTLPLLRPAKIKTVVTVHDLGYEYLPAYHQFPHKLWLTYFTEYAVHRADRLIAVSHATKQDLINKLGAAASKIRVVYEALAATPVVPKKSIETVNKYGLRNPYIIFVGTVQPRKNLVRAIEAFSLLKKQYSAFAHLEFVIIGKKGWLSEEIYAAPSKYGVASSVKFLGYVSEEDTMRLWMHAEITFYATLFEGFGLPILVSQQLRVPVLTAKQDPFMEVGGDACLYVDPISVKGMMEGMVTLLENGDLRVKLIEKGEQNLKRFSWVKAARETLDVIEEIGRKKT